jgi:pyrimidine-nucleoside phosphorylase
VLKGRGPQDLIEISLELTARMLVMGKIAADRADGVRRARSAIASGAGVDRFRAIVEWQGGDPRVVDDYRRLPSVTGRHVIAATRPGYLASLDAELIGRASVALGAGRDRVQDAIDPGVGIMVKAKPGDLVRAGDAILELQYRDSSRLPAAEALASRAVVIGDARPPLQPLIVGEVR